MKDELLLVERVQGPPGCGRLCLGHAALSAHKVHLHPRGCGQLDWCELELERITISWGHTGQSLGPRFALQSPGSDDLHLQVPSVVPHAQLDVSESRRRQHLPPDELPRPEALDELAQLPVGSQTIGGSQPATQAIK